MTKVFENGITAQEVVLYGSDGEPATEEGGGLTDTQLRASAVPTSDKGPAQTVTRTFTQNDDISTARDITAAPTAGQKIVAMDIYVSVDTAGYVTILTETGGEVLAGAYCAANSLVPFTLRGYLKGATADKKLQMKSSVASKGACTAVYFSEA